MTLRTRTPTALALVLALLLIPAAVAPADQAYDKVAAAYALSGGRLDACAFSTAELQAALAGIPPQIKDVVPDLRKAMQGAIDARRRGDCKGKHPSRGGGAATPPAGVTTPTTPTPTPAAPAPVTTAPAATVPQTTPTPPATTAAPAQSQPASTGTGRDQTPLLIALIAVGGLLLAVLLLWGWARLRGWDPTWTARWRQAWGEAGYRTSATWSEFTDWLRLGR
jgi:cobalamin biosynthesis Mg chelatase CobN